MKYNNEYIKTKRKEIGLKQIELAEIIGLTASEMSKIETGNRRISLDTFSKLNKVLKFTKEELKKLDVEGLIEYTSYASKMDKLFSQNEIRFLEMLDRNQLMDLKNYIYFMTNKKTTNEEKNAVKTLIKSLTK